MLDDSHNANMYDAQPCHRTRTVNAQGSTMGYIEYAAAPIVRVGKGVTLVDKSVSNGQLTDLIT